MLLVFIFQAKVAALMFNEAIVAACLFVVCAIASMLGFHVHCKF